MKENGDGDALPTFGADGTQEEVGEEATQQDEGPAPDASSVPPGPLLESPVKGGGANGVNPNGTSSSSGGGIPSLPPAFTPSIDKILNDVEKAVPHVPLPEGLTIAELRLRLSGKKKVK